MRRTLGLAAVAAVVVVVVVTVAAAGGTSSSSGLIVFPATLPGQNEPQLFSIQPSGAGLTQLTKGAVPAQDPAFSPSGTRLAFARFGYGIYTMASDGTGLKRLTTSTRDAYPTWSPNGRQIAFVRPVKSAWKVFVMPSTGGKQLQLKQSPAAGRPLWTTKGLLVPTAADLLRVDARTGKVLKYYNATLDPIWGLNTVAVSPGVTMMTYWGSRDPIPGDMECGDGPCQRYGLYYESLTAKKKTGKLIVKDSGPAAFSPDGQRLAFVVDGAVTLRSLATGAQTQLPTPGITPVTSTPLAWR